MNDIIKKNWKIIIPLLFTLAILFGFKNHEPDFSSLTKKQTLSYKNTDTDNKDLNYYYKKAQDLAQTQNQTISASFLAVGDIMLSRNVAQGIKNAGDPLLPFKNIKNVFVQADFAFGNLESPIAQNTGIIGGHSLVFGSPKENMQSLIENKFKILNLANNHALDLGLSGLTYTTKFLDENKIEHIGAGKNLQQAWKYESVDQNGIKICFVGASYASINDNGKTANNNVARIEDIKNLKLQIKNSKSLCDFVVASMHAGTEYTRNPNQTQIDFAHAAIEAGADMVIGGHPHWIQTVEKYKGKYIFYSLGNFIFDQMWSQDTREGLVLKINISKDQTNNPLAPNAANLDDLQGTKIPAKLESVQLIPVVIDDYAIPRAANETETNNILQKIGETSNVLK